LRCTSSNKNVPSIEQVEGEGKQVVGRESRRD